RPRGPTAGAAPPPPLQAARVGADLLSALACAHAAGVLHRDVKPGNVLIGPDERTVLTDFGIATFSGDPALSQAGMMSEPEGRGAAWTEKRATQERATRGGGASRAPRRRARKQSEPEGRGAARTGDRARQERATREGGASRAPRR